MLLRPGFKIKKLGEINTQNATLIKLLKRFLFSCMIHVHEAKCEPIECNESERNGSLVQPIKGSFLYYLNLGLNEVDIFDDVRDRWPTVRRFYDRLCIELSRFLGLDTQQGSSFQVSRQTGRSVRCSFAVNHGHRRCHLAPKWQTPDSWRLHDWLHRVTKDSTVPRTKLHCKVL